MNVKVNESEKEPVTWIPGTTNKDKIENLNRRLHDQDNRIIALERGLEAVLRRMEASTSPDDEPGWFGVDE